MSQMKKRVVALFLALVMCVGMLPSSVFAAEELPEGESVIASEILSETSKKSDAAEEETGDETETETEAVISNDSGAVSDDTAIVPEIVGEKEKSPATVEELGAAFEKVGETEDVDDALAALDEYLAVYDRLSDEDKAANAEALANAQAYRETLVAAKGAGENENGDENEDDQELDSGMNVTPERTLAYNWGYTPPAVTATRKPNVRIVFSDGKTKPSSGYATGTSFTYDAMQGTTVGQPSTYYRAASRYTFSYYSCRDGGGMGTSAVTKPGDWWNPSGTIYMDIHVKEDSTGKIPSTGGNTGGNTGTNPGFGTGHHITVPVYKVILDSSMPLGYQTPSLVTTLRITCNDGENHSGFNHYTKLSQFHPTNVGLSTTDWAGWRFASTYSGGSGNKTFYDWTSEDVDATANVTGSGDYPCSKNFYLIYNKPATYTVTVKYVYENGTMAASSVSKTDVNGTAYSWTSPTISGYTPDQKTVSGTINGNQTITVTYKQAVETRLIFNSNANGDTVENMPSEVTYDNIRAGSSTVVPIENKTPTRSGYVFTGWNTNKDGSGDAYQPNEQIVLKGGTTTRLYAQWEEAKPAIQVTKTVNGSSEKKPGDTVTFVIKVENTGSTSFDTVDISDSLPAGLTYKSATPKPTTTNPYIIWTFSGTEFKPGGTKSVVVQATVDEGASGTLTNTASAAAIKNGDPNSTTDSDTADVTVPSGVKIIYKPGVGGIGNDVTDPWTSDHDNDPYGYTVKKYNNVGFTAQTGYTFQYWQGSDGKTYDPGDGVSPKPSSDLTLTAIWSAPEPGTAKGSFTVKKSFGGLENGTESPAVTLTYEAYRTKDGNKVGNSETGTVSLTKMEDGTYQGNITPTIWDSGAVGKMTETEKARYKNVVIVTEDLESAKVTGYQLSSFGPLYPADGTKDGDNKVKFEIPGATFEKPLSVKNSYSKPKTSIQTVTLGVHFTNDKAAGSTVMPALSDIPDNFTLKYSYTDADGKHEGVLKKADARAWLDSDNNNCPTLTWDKEGQPLTVKVAEGTPVYIELEEGNYLLGDNASKFIWTRFDTTDSGIIGGNTESGTGKVKVTYAAWDRNSKNYSFNYYKQPEPTVTVRWQDEDGTLLHGPINVSKDKVPTADKYNELSKKNNPTKEEDENYTYTFKEWVREEDGDGNVTYTATYTATRKPEAPTVEDLKGNVKLGVWILCDETTNHHDWTAYTMSGGYTVGTVTANTGSNKDQYPYTCTVSVTVDNQNNFWMNTNSATAGVKWNAEHQLKSDARTMTATLYHNGTAWTLPQNQTLNPDVTLGGTGWNYFKILTIHKPMPIKIEKAAEKDTVLAGGRVNYTVTVINEAAMEQTVEFKDTLGNGLTLAGDVTIDYGGTPDAETKNSLSFTFTLAAEGKATITYSAVAQSGLDAGIKLTNTAEAKVWTRTVTAEKTVTVTADPVTPEVEYAIDVQKALNKTEAQAANGVKNGDVVNYTVTVTNTGEATIYDLTIDDTMDPGLTLKELTGAKLNGETITLTQLSSAKDATTGKTTTKWGTVKEFAVNDVVELTYTATVSNKGTEKIKLHNVAHGIGYQEKAEEQSQTKSVAKVSAMLLSDYVEDSDSESVETTVSGVTGRTPVEDWSNADVDGKPTGSGTEVEVDPTPETKLKVEKKVRGTQTTFHTGDLVEYEINVTNEGNAPAENVVVTDELDSRLTFARWWAYNEAANIKVENNKQEPADHQYSLGTIPAGGSARVIIRVRVKDNVFTSNDAVTIPNVATATYTGKPDEEKPEGKTEITVEPKEKIIPVAIVKVFRANDANKDKAPAKTDIPETFYFDYRYTDKDGEHIGKLELSDTGVTETEVQNGVTYQWPALNVKVMEGDEPVVITLTESNYLIGENKGDFVWKNASYSGSGTTTENTGTVKVFYYAKSTTPQLSYVYNNYEKENTPVIPDPDEFEVTVKYVDDKGNPIPGYTDVKVATTDGGKYDVTDKKVSIEGYTFKEVQENKDLKGTVTGNTTIVLVYTKNEVVEPEPNEYEVTVKYVDDKGNAIAGYPDVKTATTDGGKYDVTDKKVSIEGYTFKEVQENKALKGTLTGNTTIVLVYTKNEIVEPEPNEYEVTVKYVDENGDPIAGYSDVKVATTGGGKYDVTDKKMSIEGYTFKEVQDNKALEGTVTENTTIVLVYTKNGGGEPEHKTYTLRYNANGGTGAPATQTQEDNQTFAISNGRPTRNNYSFRGWALTANGPVAYQPGGSITIEGDEQTLYAIWQYNGNDDDDDDDDPDPSPSRDPEPTESPEPTPGPSREPEPAPSVEPGPTEDLNDPEVPLGELEELLPDEVPLADLPHEDEELEELMDDEVPLANVPETGDKAPMWGLTAGISGLALLFLSKRKKEEEDA